MKKLLLVVCVLAISNPALAQDGYPRPILNAKEILDRSKSFEKDMKSLGFDGSLQSCEHVVDVAVGVRGGNNSYGAVCVLKIGAHTESVMVCNDEFMGRFALLARGFGISDDGVTEFVRHNCYGG